MRKYLLFFALGLGNLCLAQDFHFSQSEVFKLTKHALSLEKENGRALIAYRTQWIGASSFRNIFTSYHHKIADFTIGGKVIQNDAGKESLKTTQFLLDFNYKKILNNSDDYIAFGASAGLLQQRFRPASFKFDQQYIDGEGFDAALENGENFESNNRLLPLVHAGLQAKKYFDSFSVKLGVAANNLNRPSSGFYNEKIYFPIAIASFVETEIELNNDVFVDGYLMYNHFNYSDWMIGGRLKYEYNDEYLLTFGLVHRLNNSVIVEAGIAIQQCVFVLSYDFLYNDISSVKNQIGNFELSASYSFQ